jgi:hypothetical protein
MTIQRASTSRFRRFHGLSGRSANFTYSLLRIRRDSLMIGVERMDGPGWFKTT